MNRFSRFVLGLVVFAAVGFPAAAGEPPLKDKDPQSAFEPRSRPGDGQRFLQQFVGDWEAAKTFHPRTGDPTRVMGECRQTMIHDGRFLQSEFVFGQDDKKTTGLGIIGFEPNSGKFTSVWTDSRSTRMSFRQSEEEFNGTEIVLHSRSLNPDAKDERRSRTLTRLEDDGRKIVHRQYTTGQDGKERLVMELLLTRKEAPPAPKTPDN
jgi:Protein of unknown function (DUF1579)